MTGTSSPIVLAPFANERIREWPLANIQAFIECGLQQDRRFVIAGTRAQRPLANQLVRPFSSERVENLCGSTSWAELYAFVRAAPFIVANNSGIAHMAAGLGQWVLCIFAGSHSWMEWMPRGPKVVTIAAMPKCAPCCSDICSFGHSCMTDVTGELAYQTIEYAMRVHSQQ